MADWRWECVTDDLLDKLPPDALRAVRQREPGVLTSSLPHGRSRTTTPGRYHI